MTTSRVALSSWQAANVFVVVLDDYFPAFKGTGLARINGVQRDVTLEPVGARRGVTNEFRLTFEPIEGVGPALVTAVPIGTALYLSLE